MLTVKYCEVFVIVMTQCISLALLFFVLSRVILGWLDWLDLQERLEKKEIEACQEIREYKALKEMVYVYISAIINNLYYIVY